MIRLIHFITSVADWGQGRFCDWHLFGLLSNVITIIWLSFSWSILEAKICGLFFKPWLWISKYKLIIKICCNVHKTAYDRYHYFSVRLQILDWIQIYAWNKRLHYVTPCMIYWCCDSTLSFVKFIKNGKKIHYFISIYSNFSTF